MHNDSVNCEALQRALREGHEVTREQSAHVDGCDACMDVWLTTALENKPEVAIPSDFAARIAATLPDRPNHRAAVRRPRHWGLAIAFVIVTVVLVVSFSNAVPVNSWIGVVFIMLIATEVAGLALWLGPKSTGH